MAVPDLLKIDGVLLSVGVLCNGDVQEVVIPLANDNAIISDLSRCNDAVSSFHSTVLPNFLGCLSSDAEVRFIAAENMTVGGIPFREDYAPGDNPGILAAGAAPSNVAALVSFYCDPTDLQANQRMRVGKMFMPGIPTDDLIGDNITGGIVANLQALGDQMVAGWATAQPGGKWYRVISTKTQIAPGDPTHLYNTQGAIVRMRVATQRRRLYPRL